MSVGCSMIVRDGAPSIETTIASVRPHVDQVAVWVDDRTSDATLEILERLSRQEGAPLTFATAAFEWFAQARNESFDLVDADHEWIVWLDDDVLIGGENLRELTEQAANLGANWIAADYDYADLPDGSKRVLKRSRVARRAAAEWEGAIHEDLVTVPATSRPIVGQVHPHELSVRHLRRDLRPGRYIDEILAATANLARTPHAFLHLGNEYLAMGRPIEAEAALKRYVTERHDLRVLPSYNWARLEALEQIANVYAQLEDGETSARFRAQAQAERTAGDLHLAKLRRSFLASPTRSEPKVARNEPCWCGSGQKFKRCHGA
jgi:uncharacterized protein YchJ